MSKNEDKKKSFVMYDSFLEAMKHLNDAEFRECVMKISDYALDGIDKESESPYVNIILAMANKGFALITTRKKVTQMLQQCLLPFVWYKRQSMNNFIFYEIFEQKFGDIKKKQYLCSVLG